MEQHLVPYDMECMKMAMLKHEEIFKQQVYELHRLYRIQKMLMKKTTPVPRDPKTTQPPQNEMLPRPSQGCINRFQQDDEAIDLSLGLGNYYYTQKSSKKLSPTMLTSDSVMSFSSSSSGSSSSLSKRVCAGGGNEVEYQEHSRRQVRATEQPPWLLQVLGLNI